jgi:hypothetical protein
VTKPGRQWIHADAGYYSDPVVLKIKARFGWAGVIFFDAFLRACKRSVPQGQITYVSEDELVHFLGIADLSRVSCAGDAWTITELWRFLARQRPPMVTSRVVHGRVMASACAWDAWEMSALSASHAERMRRSRAEKRATNVPDRGTSAQGRLEVGGGRLEVGGGSVRGEGAGPAPASSQGADAVPAKSNGAGTAAATNGTGRPDPTSLIAMVATIESKNAAQA